MLSLSVRGECSSILQVGIPNSSRIPTASTDPLNQRRSKAEGLYADSASRALLQDELAKAKAMLKGKMFRQAMAMVLSLEEGGSGLAICGIYADTWRAYAARSGEGSRGGCCRNTM